MNNTNYVKPYLLLKKYFSLLQENNKNYSQRALARDLELSSGQVNLIFNGKREISDQVYLKIKKTLKLNELMAKELAKSIVISRLDGSLFKDSLSDLNLNEIPPFEHLGANKINLFEKWYYPAILDLTTCSNFKNDLKWIAKKLSLNIIQVIEAIDVILKLDLLECKNGQYKKKETNIRLLNETQKNIITNYHIQNLSNTVDLLRNTKSEEFSRRHVISTTLATNPEKIDQVKEILSTTLYEASKELATPKECCQEVYQINFQLIPLTTPNQ